MEGADEIVMDDAARAGWELSIVRTNILRYTESRFRFRGGIPDLKNCSGAIAAQDRENGVTSI